MDAYNAHDLERFVRCYADDAVITTADGAVLSSGLDEIRSSYREAFDEFPDLYAKVTNYVRAGRWVVSEEQAFRRDESLHVVVAYELSGDRICRVIVLN